MYVNVGEIWIPDNMIGNTKSLNLAHADAIRAAKIESDGTITMPTVYYVEISCVISVDVFPFDKQACELPVMSFAYLPADVITNGSVSPEALSLYAGNGEWNVTHVTTKPISFVTMQLFYFIIHVKRVPNFYVYVIALPCFILTLLSIIGMFWSSNIKKEQLTKLSIGLTSLVSMTVLLDLLSTSIPKTEVFPLLGICVVVCVGIISAACVIIVVFSLQNPRKKTEAEMKRAEEEEKRLTKGEKIRHFFTRWAQVDLTKFGETEAYSNFINQTQLIYDEIFTNRRYNHLLSPIFHQAPNDTAPFEVYYSMFFFKMFLLDAESQMLGIDFELKETWKDARLAWDPEEYGGVNKLFVNVDSVWVPDNQVANVKSLDAVHPSTSREVEISHDGTVLMPTVYYAEISCAINVRIFPFDKQSCRIPILSFSYGVRQVTTNGSVDKVLSLTTAGNGEWEVTGITTNSFIYGPGNIFNYVIGLKRVPHYYVYVIAFPCFILTTISTVGTFWSPNYNKEQLTKLSIGLTSLISMTVLLDLLSNSIPKTRVFPLLGIYVLICVGIISASCVAIVVYALPNPKKPTESALKKLQEEKNLLTTSRKMMRYLKETLNHRHIFFQLIFQAMNFVAFIVFLSHWD
ncbi:unnamed protein product, partial [Mesorhabditis belari]|uniref:Uncharacterized protein n=1 Tax=Mesorhabditis belari TaxID=2138241 RepID=A0AAF3EH73_9BILA